MTRVTATGAALLAGLACAAAVRAHHTGSMYDTTPVWITGTVVRFEPINPHTITTVEERSADGEIRRWAVEGPGRAQLGQRDLGTGVPRVGDTIRLCGFPYKSAEELSRLFPEADFQARRPAADTDGTPIEFVAGHLMVMPDGERRLWEPHGVLAACIRSSDESRQSWLDFLDSNPRAREAWCEQQAYVSVRSTPSLMEFVEALNRSIAYRCR